MKKISILYHSGTGNTEMMAQSVLKGAQSNGAEVKLFTFDDAALEDVISADAVGFGCPATGTEELEADVVVPFLEELGDQISGKPLVLFGSYGWGGGAYMEDWEAQMKEKGANLLSEGLTIEETPDEEGLETCESLGTLLAK